MSTDSLRRSLLNDLNRSECMSCLPGQKGTKMANGERRPLSEVRLHSFEIKKETNKQNKTKRHNKKQYADESYKTKKTILQLRT